MNIKNYIQKVILDLIQDLRRLPLPLLNNLRGRFQIKFGMTALFNNGGFTLIELLVVVLIIGILAAVAVPQYKKAVVKTNLANALPSIKNIIQAQELHFLEKGTYAGLEKNLSVTVPEPQDVRIDLNHGGKNILRVTVCPGITKQEGCSPYGDKRVIIADVHFSRESSHPGQASCLYKKPYGYLCKLWCDTFSPCWQNWNSF